jgi:hypothetical protein
MIPHRICVGTIGEGLYYSDDGGASYVRSWRGMFVECHVRALVVDPRRPDTLILGNELGLWKSTDHGESWSPFRSPLKGKQVWSVLLHPADPDSIFVGTCPSAIFRSSDAGATWQASHAPIRQDCPRIVHSRVTALAADPNQGGFLFAGTEVDGIWRSQDGGASWQKASKGLSSEDIHAIVVLPGSPARVLVATDNDINVSTDGGSSWTPLGIGRTLPLPYRRALTQRAGAANAMLMGLGDGPPGTRGGICHSSDGGAIWSSASMPGQPNSTIWNFATHAADADLVYASSVCGEVYRSIDGGKQWSKLGREFGEIRALAWSPRTHP